MSPTPLHASIAGVIALPASIVCGALIAACPSAQADALAEAIDQFLADVDDGDDQDLAKDVFSAVDRIGIRLACDLAINELYEARIMARALAGVGAAEYEPQDDREFERFDAARDAADKRAETDWRAMMARVLGAVEGALTAQIRNVRIAA